MAFDLAFIWAAIIAAAVFLYVCMDGFDLGLGILFPVVHGKEDRDVMVNSVAPVWDGNETWLVLGGGGLLAVFPLATLKTQKYWPPVARVDNVHGDKNVFCACIPVDAYKDDVEA